MIAKRDPYRRDTHWADDFHSFLHRSSEITGNLTTGTADVQPFIDFNGTQRPFVLLRIALITDLITMHDGP